MMLRLDEQGITPDLGPNVWREVYLECKQKMDNQKRKWKPMSPEETWNHVTQPSEGYFNKGEPCPYCGSRFVLICTYRHGCQTCKKIWHEKPEGRELMFDLLSKEEEPNGKGQVGRDCRGEDVFGQGREEDSGISTP
jgi:hypothetical protein